MHDITTDLEVPTRLAIVIDRSAAIVSAGAAAQLDAREATDKAVAEALMIESVLRTIKSRPSPRLPATTDEARTMEDHMLFYCDRERMGELDFLLHAPASAREGARGKPRPDLSMHYVSFSTRCNSAHSMPSSSTSPCLKSLRPACAWCGPSCLD